MGVRRGAKLEWMQGGFAGKLLDVEYVCSRCSLEEALKIV